MSGIPKNLKLYGPSAVLCVVLAVALLECWRMPLSTSGPRALVAFAVAGLVISLAHNAFFPARIDGDSKNSIEDPASVSRAIAYDSVVFTLAGLATVVAAAPQWETALLVSGACLLIGAFFGLLFGYPQGVAQSTTTPPHGHLDQMEPRASIPDGTPLLAKPTQQSTPQKNLIAESASTLGKVIAGFTLARAGPLTQHFHLICDAVAPALGRQSAVGNSVLAGAIILYFFGVGFFSGLLLPSYFMSGKFGS
jgi:hypothetical protein